MHFFQALCVLSYFHLFFFPFFIWLSRHLISEAGGARLPLQLATGAPCGVGLSNCLQSNSVFYLVSGSQLIEHQLILISQGRTDPALPLLSVV